MEYFDKEYIWIPEILIERWIQQKRLKSIFVCHVSLIIPSYLATGFPCVILWLDSRIKYGTGYESSHFLLDYPIKSGNDINL